MAAADVVIGKVTGVHGVQGWLKVMPYTEQPEAATQYQPWRLAGVEARVTAHKRNGVGLLVKLEGLDDRDQAKALVGQLISVARSALPVLEGEYYWADLIGLQVVDTQGKTLGTVVSMLETGVHDVVVVKQGKREFALPYRRGDVIKAIDLLQGTMTVDWEDEL
jgi:16S rRNA processing protein RimM